MDMLLAIRQGARQIWTAVRTSGWLYALRALTAFGQWGLLIGLAGSTLLVAAALGGVLSASILPVKTALSLANVGWLFLLALGPLTLWSARALLRRVSTVPAVFASRRWAVRRRAGALAAAALTIPVALVVAVDRNIGTILANGILLYLGKGQVPILFFMAALAGGIFGLRRRTRRWLFGFGALGFFLVGLLVLLGPWLEAGSGRRSVVAALRPGQQEDLAAFLFMTIAYLAAGLGCLVWLPRPAPVVSSGPAVVSFPQLPPAPFPPSPPAPVTLPPLPPPLSSSPAPPPTPITLPRIPQTRRIRRRLDL